MKTPCYYCGWPVRKLASGKIEKRVRFYGFQEDTGDRIEAHPSCYREYNEEPES